MKLVRVASPDTLLRHLLSAAYAIMVTVWFSIRQWSISTLERPSSVATTSQSDPRDCARRLRSTSASLRTRMSGLMSRSQSLLMESGITGKISHIMINVINFNKTLSQTSYPPPISACLKEGFHKSKFAYKRKGDKPIKGFQRIIVWLSC